MANPFEGQSFARMGTIYHNFGEMVDSLEATGKALSGDSDTAATGKAFTDLAQYYRDQILPQFRAWISEEVSRSSGFPVEFTHDQLMLDFGDEPASKQQGASGQPDMSQHASVQGSGAHPIFGDVRVRRALSTALDQEMFKDTTGLLNAWGEGYANHLSTGTTTAFNPFVEILAEQAYAYDAEAADRLLTEAGWVKGPDGVRVCQGCEYAGAPLRNAQPDATPFEFDLLAAATSDPLDAPARAGLYAQIEAQHFADVPYMSAWSAAVLPYYSRAIFDEAGLDYPPQTEDWTWEKVAEVARMLTIDDQGRNALDPYFDPSRVVQHGSGVTPTTEPFIALPIYDPKLLTAGQNRERDTRKARTPWWRSTTAKVGAGVVAVAAVATTGAAVATNQCGNSGGSTATVVAEVPTELLSPDVEAFEWSDGMPFTQEDLDAYLQSVGLEGVSWTAYADGEGDSFNTFTLDDTFTDPLVELTGGAAAVVTLPAAGGPDLACGATLPAGMTVICAPGAAGAPAPGDYVFVLGGVRSDLAERQDGREYRYNVFFQDTGRPVIFPEGDPRPEFPYNTLTRTNSYFEIFAAGGEDWSLNGTHIDVPGQQSLDFSEPGPAQDIAPNVRAAIGGNAFGLLVPADFFAGPEVLFNVGTNAHAAGVDYAADNVALDVLGETSLDVKPAISGFQEYLAARGDDTIELIKSRLVDYKEWVRAGNGTEIRAHLDQSAIDHWGANRCDLYFNALAGDDTFGLEVRDARGPAPWTWQVFGETVGTIPDAYEYDVTITQAGATQDATVHFAWDEAKQDIRVFSPCITAAEATPGAGAPADVDSAVEQTITKGMAEFAEARRTGSGEGYLALLHPIVLEFYGPDVCRSFYTSEVGADPAFALGAIASISGPEPFDYVTNNGTAVGTADAYTVVVDTTAGGQTRPTTWHFAVVGGAFKVFQPCAR